MAEGSEHDALSSDAVDRLLPGVVSYGDPLSSRPTDRCLPVDITAVRKALDGLDGFGTAAHRAASAAALHTAVTDRANSLAARLDGPDEIPEPRSVAQHYFRIRTATLPADRGLWHCLVTVARAAEDLIDAPVAGSDVLRIGVAVTTVLDMTPQPDGAEPDSPPAAGWAPTWSIEEIWLRRWIIGHQLHAMFNVHAAYALADAADALREGRHHAATTAIDTATRIVEGFASARAQALALPAAFYQDILRPTMLPPLTAAPLTGRMHLEYQGYRHRLAELLNLLPQSSSGLAAAQPTLALSRERLLEADLIESERHVTSVEPLIRDSRSLIQTGRSTENAVGALRRIRHRRAAMIADYVRFPDRVAQDEGTGVGRTGRA